VRDESLVSRPSRSWHMDPPRRLAERRPRRRQLVWQWIGLGGKPP
jgi:hypothetical protein